MRRARHLLPILALAAMLFGIVAPVTAATKVAATVQTPKVEPSLAAAIAKNAGKEFRVIVQAEPAKTKATRELNQKQVAAQIRQKVEGKEGKIQASLGIVNGYAATLTGKRILQLARTPGVRAISGDHRVSLHAGTSTFDISTLESALDPDTRILSLQTVAARADDVWAIQPNAGQAVTVAVLDSGIHPSPELNAHFGVDVVTGTTGLGDPGGHGTHVAGIITGTGSLFGYKYRGAAPGVRVLSVKVTDDQGHASYSSIIKGLQWIVAYKDVHNIRVANMSLGATQATSYRNDPLAAAAELAWFSGIVVVASAGNAGSQAGTITIPAADPYIITVGATNQRSTKFTGDDVIPAWSSRGPTAFDGLNKPDLVAGGYRIVSVRSPNSFLEQALGVNRIVGQNYFRLSGTSMAAPVVAGTAAMILTANPNLSPNQVKYILTKTARKHSGISSNAQGAGSVNAIAAVQLAYQGVGSNQANVGQRPSDIFARSIYPLAYGAPLIWRQSGSWDSGSWDSGSWDSGSWDSVAWENLCWECIDWASADWSSVSWESLTGWASGSWDSGSWDSGSWDSGSWDSGGWDSGQWDSGQWDAAQVADELEPGLTDDIMDYDTPDEPYTLDETTTTTSETTTTDSTGAGSTGN